MEVTAEQFEAASRRMENQRVRYSTIAAVHYSADRDRLVIDLSNGLALSFPPQLAQVLQHATAEDLAETEITASELSVYFPRMARTIASTFRGRIYVSSRAYSQRR